MSKPVALRFRVEVDEDADLSYLEQECFADSSPQELDPNNYESFGCIIEGQCPDTGEWFDLGDFDGAYQDYAIWGCDYYIYGNEEIPTPGVYDPVTVRDSFPLFWWYFDHLFPDLNEG